MPQYEVHAVQGPANKRDAERVKMEIARAYNRATQEGGRIAAEHVLASAGDPSRRTAGLEFIFLVAELPQHDGEPAA